MLHRPCLHLRRHSYLETELQTHTCPVCYELMAPPAKAPMLLFPCGHSFCAQCINAHLARGSNTCPYCREQVRSRTSRLGCTWRALAACAVVTYPGCWPTVPPPDPIQGRQPLAEGLDRDLHGEALPIRARTGPCPNGKARHAPTRAAHVVSLAHERVCCRARRRVGAARRHCCAAVARRSCKQAAGGHRPRTEAQCRSTGRTEVSGAVAAAEAGTTTPTGAWEQAVAPLAAAVAAQACLSTTAHPRTTAARVVPAAPCHHTGQATCRLGTLRRRQGGTTTGRRAPGHRPAVGHRARRRRSTAGSWWGHRPRPTGAGVHPWPVAAGAAPRVGRRGTMSTKR